MNKAELVERVSRKTAMTKVQSEQILDAALEVICSTVAKGDEVKLVGFGTFSRAMRKARQARNPRTGSTVSVPGGKVPRFKPGKDFRDQVK